MDDKDYKMVIDGEYDYTELEKFKNQVNRIVIDLTEQSTRKRTIPKSTKVIVWNNTFGLNVGCAPCFCCRTIYITQSNFEAGHIISYKKGGSNLAENLRPICGTCNKSMSTKNMYEFIRDNKYW